MRLARRARPLDRQAESQRPEHRLELDRSGESQTFGDADFGGTPTLFTATINGAPRALVGAINKDGLFFAWDRNNLAAGPVWQSTIADPSGSPRSIVSASCDGTRLYVGGGGATINGTSCYGNISALDPATGAFIWRSCQAAS